MDDTDRTPIIIISPMAYVDMILAFDSCEVEISGVGDVEQERNEWRANSITVIPQSCSIAKTLFDPLAYNLYMARLLMEGKADEARRKKLWWHSHVKDPARFSLIDIRFMEKTFASMVPRSEPNPWLLSIVGNKYRRLGVRLDIFRPERVVHDRLPIYLSPNPGRQALQDLYYERKREMEKIVRERITIVKERWTRDDEEEEK